MCTMIEQANLGGLDVSIEAMIGEGEFGLVYRGTTTFLGTNPRAIVALKCLSKPKAAGNEVCEGNDDNAMRLLFREIDIHRRLCHPHILPMHGYLEDARYVLVVVEYAARGDAATYLTKEDLPFAERFNVALQLLRQVCLAVSYLHSVQVAHRDIKPENILVFGSESEPVSESSSLGCDNIVAKLCDFGSAVNWKEGERHSTLCGTPEYVPPEVLVSSGAAVPRIPSSPLASAGSSMSYVPEYVDRWMLGVLAIDLVYNTTPFRPSPHDLLVLDDDAIREEIFAKILAFSVEAIELDRRNLLQTDHVYGAYQDFVTRSLQIVPTDRIPPSDAAHDVAQHCVLKSHLNEAHSL